MFSKFLSILNHETAGQLTRFLKSLIDCGIVQNVSGPHHNALGPRVWRVWL